MRFEEFKSFHCIKYEKSNCVSSMSQVANANSGNMIFFFFLFSRNKPTNDLYH